MTDAYVTLRHQCCFVTIAAVEIENKGTNKQTATATATGTLLNKRFNEQNNSCARTL